MFGVIPLRDDFKTNLAPVGSIPQPRFIRQSPTVQLQPTVDECTIKKAKVESHKGSTGDLQFERFPTPSSFSYCKTHFKTEGCSGSDHLVEAMPWIREIELANSVDDLETLLSHCRTGVPEF